MEKEYSILYAEDEEQVRQNYVLYLENYFDKIYQACNGIEALSLYKDKKPDILLLDITMPELNGLEVIRRIREEDEKTPIIILSAHSHKEYLFDAIKLNLVDYLVKPINRSEFKKVIEETIEKVNTIKYSNPEENKIHIDSTCYWDKGVRIFFHNQKVLDLTNNETKLFELLLEKKNQVVNPSDISTYVWNSDEENKNDASIRNLVKRLRRKLPVDIVQSIYGSGYILNF